MDRPPARRFAPRVTAPPASIGEASTRTRLLVTVYALDTLTALAILAYGNAAYLIDELNAADAVPAFALALYGLCKIASAPIAGRVFDRAGPRATLGAGVGMLATGLAIILLTHSTAGYLVALAPISAGLGFAWLVVFAAMGRLTTAEGRASETGFIAVASILAVASGFGGAGLVAETGFWWLPFTIAIGLGALAAAASAPLAPSGRAFRPSMTEDDAAPAPPVAHTAGAPRAAAAAVLLHFAVATAVAGVFGAYILRTLDFSLVAAGLLLVPAVSSGGLAMLLGGRWSRPGRRLLETGAVYVVGAIGAFALAAAEGPVTFAIAALPLGIALGGAVPLVNAAVLDVATASSRTGRALGWLFLAQGVGTVGGPLLAGVVLAAYGTREALIAIGLAYLAGALVDAVNNRRTRL